MLPFERWNDPLAGTDFSYEDMVENQFFWKNQELLAPEKYGERDCFVLKSTPGSQDRTYYDSVTSWIDRRILFPVHVVKTLHGTGQQKEVHYFGLRQVGGAWSATQVEAKLPGKPGSSMLVIEGGSAKGKSWSQGLCDRPVQRPRRRKQSKSNRLTGCCGSLMLSLEHPGAVVRASWDKLLFIRRCRGTI